MFADPFGDRLSSPFSTTSSAGTRPVEGPHVPGTDVQAVASARTSAVGRGGLAWQTSLYDALNLFL